MGYPILIDTRAFDRDSLARHTNSIQLNSQSFARARFHQSVMSHCALTNRGGSGEVFVLPFPPFVLGFVTAFPLSFSLAHPGRRSTHCVSHFVTPVESLVLTSSAVDPANSRRRTAYGESFNSLRSSCVTFATISKVSPSFKDEPGPFPKMESRIFLIHWTLFTNFLHASFP